MQTVSEIMSRNVRTVSQNDTVQHAAQLMDELNVGALPVCDGARLVGMITDRDITVRATANGCAPHATHVGDVMSADVCTVFANDSVDDAMRCMGDAQVRRVPVLDRDSHDLVGIVSLGDAATHHTPGLERTIDQISEPGAPLPH